MWLVRAVSSGIFASQLNSKKMGAGLSRSPVRLVQSRGDLSLCNRLERTDEPRLTSGWRWIVRSRGKTWLSPSVPAGQRGIYGAARTAIHNDAVTVLRSASLACATYLVGTGTSVRAPNMTACCRRTNATKGFSRKSTSPTRTLDASASRGNFFMNLFFSCQDREDPVSTKINGLGGLPVILVRVLQA